MLSFNKLMEIEARCNNTTKGPWAVGDKCVTSSSGYVTSTLTQEDADFIANAKQDVLDLIKSYKELALELSQE